MPVYRYSFYAVGLAVAVSTGSASAQGIGDVSLPILDFPSAEATADTKGPMCWLGRCSEDEPVKTTALVVQPEPAPDK
jgi:hypothetical protein